MNVVGGLPSVKAQSLRCLIDGGRGREEEEEEEEEEENCDCKADTDTTTSMPCR